MILSVSRRTDIPTYYSDWFFNRMAEGFLYVRNPMYPNKVSKITLSPNVIDCIVFWSKNPKPMFDRLSEIDNYKYYFQFTLTGYGKDIEAAIPHKKDVMIPTFKELSNRIGSNRVIWRYDPIVFTPIYTPQYHLKAFEQIATALNGYTEKCVISFVDIYAKIIDSMKAANAYDLSTDELTSFAKTLADIARTNNIKVATCAEKIDLAYCGIEHNCCIDKTLIESVIGQKIKCGKDKNQRAECGCMESIDIGTYNTCKNGCKYCYANNDANELVKNCKSHNPNSPFLIGNLSADDVITERKMTSLIK